MKHIPYGAFFEWTGRWWSGGNKCPRHVPNPPPGGTRVEWDEVARTFGIAPLHPLPAIPAFTADGQTPSGLTNIIDASTIESPSDTLKDVVTKATPLASDPNVMYTLLLSERLYEVVGFDANSGDGVRMPKNLSVMGRGIGKTVVRMRQDSSTLDDKTSLWGSGTPKCSVIHVDQPLKGWAIRNMTIEGTRQNASVFGGRGHDYNGVSIDNADAPLVENLRLQGIRGHYSSPPGETGSVTTFRVTNVVMRNVEVDGRELGMSSDDVADRVSSAGIMLNDTTGGALIDITVHHTFCGGGGITHWKTWGVSTFNFYGYHLESGYWEGKKLASFGLNHERIDRITHYSPTINMYRTRNELSFSLNNDMLTDWSSGSPVYGQVGSPGDLLIVDHTPDMTGLTGVHLGNTMVEVWNPYNPLSGDSSLYYQRNGADKHAPMAVDRRGNMVPLTVSASDGSWQVTNRKRV